MTLILIYRVICCPQLFQCEKTYENKAEEKEKWNEKTEGKGRGIRRGIEKRQGDGTELSGGGKEEKKEKEEEIRRVFLGTVKGFSLHKKFVQINVCEFHHAPGS